MAEPDPTIQPAAIPENTTPLAGIRTVQAVRHESHASQNCEVAPTCTRPLNPSSGGDVPSLVPDHPLRSAHPPNEESTFSRQLRQLDLEHQQRRHASVYRQSHPRGDSDDNSHGKHLSKKRPASSEAPRSERNFALAHANRATGSAPWFPAPQPVITAEPIGPSATVTVQCERPNIQAASCSTFSDVEDTRPDSIDSDDSVTADACYGSDEMIRQPDVTPITADEIHAQVEKIYMDLIQHEDFLVVFWQRMLDENSSVQYTTSVSVWRLVSARVRNFMLLSHDLLMAAQHPSAEERTTTFIIQRKFIYRIWMNGILQFFNVMRKYPEHSKEFMLDHLYFSLQMILLFYETIPVYALFWAEMMGNIARHKLMVDPSDDIWQWKSIGITWYMRASAHAPAQGKQYHNISALASPNVLAQLFYYAKALVCQLPFQSAHQSLEGLFHRVRAVANAGGGAVLGVSECDLVFVSLHSVLFQASATPSLRPQIQDYILQLGTRIDNVRADWRRQGGWIAVTNIAAIMQFGAAINPFKRLFEDETGIVPSDFSGAQCRSWLTPVLELSFGILRAVLTRTGANAGLPIDLDVLPHVHIMLVFLDSLVRRCGGSRSPLGHIVAAAPWTEAVSYLNKLQYVANKRKILVPADVESASASGSGGVAVCRDNPTPSLPEDYLMRGLIWSDVDASVTQDSEEADDGTQVVENETIDRLRIARVLSLCSSLADTCKQKGGLCLAYDAASQRFSVPASPLALLNKASEQAQILDPDRAADIDLGAN